MAISVDVLHRLCAELHLAAKCAAYSYSRFVTRYSRAPTGASVGVVRAYARARMHHSLTTPTHYVHDVIALAMIRIGMRKCGEERAPRCCREKESGFRICSSCDCLRVRFSIRSPVFLASALFLDVCKANSRCYYVM